ncbi:hypothetical protein HUK65_16240 [Rhodobacteraceae bacterium 2376]|uniref:Uncharacterized protein n=1 Tax=Rhabdonatronobacter sediminivivens TaxID=2743469 RepID=A0A7Z0I244_9RHOB|nr:hypothetical protein [Rhabdonatronobacter sediminivivens]NYS26536.1 hypothetical protein [Rhabdonatronobacter sediminivivens]
MNTPVPPAAPARAPLSDRSYCDWPAIIAGAVIAAAVSLVLYAFGVGLGLSIVSAEPGEGVSARWWTIAAGIWFIWVTVTSFGIGGYLAGRLRRPVPDATADEIESRDGAHGLTVWAAGTVIGAVLAMGGLGGVMGGVTSATGTAADSVSEAMDEQGDYFASLVLRGDTGEAISSDAIAETRIILMRSAAQGEVSAADRERLVQVAAAETGQTPNEVEEGVDQALTAFDDARQQAVEAAEQVRIAGVIAGFVIAATLLISAVAAYLAAQTGGSHRDRQIPLSGRPATASAGRAPSGPTVGA